MWNSQPLSAQGGRAASLIGQGGENKIGLLDLPTPFLFLEVSCLQAMVVPCPPPTTHSITVLQVKAAKSPFSVLRNPFSCHIYPHPPILSLLVKKKKRWFFSPPPSHPLSYLSSESRREQGNYLRSPLQDIKRRPRGNQEIHGTEEKERNTK